MELSELARPHRYGLPLCGKSPLLWPLVEKAEEPEIKSPTSAGLLKKQERVAVGTFIPGNLV